MTGPTPLEPPTPSARGQVVGAALDLYAMTNPALGSAVLWAFLKGAERGTHGVELPLLFLPIPVLLSTSIASTFDGTNRRTGFFGWLDRHPEATIELADRVRRTRHISRRALLFASRTRLITADAGGYFRPTGALSEAKLRRAGDAVKPLFPLAKRFGTWVGDVASARAIYYALGLTP